MSTSTSAVALSTIGYCCTSRQVTSNPESTNEQNTVIKSLLGKCSGCLCNHQLLASFTIEGACNRQIFEIWIEACLIPELKPGQILVIDNATFHQGGRIEQLIEAAGCQVWYLPPYSPDLNKIEQSWSWLNSKSRKQLDQFPTLRNAMEHVLHLAS